MVTSLLALWEISLALCLVGTLALFVLIVARLVSSRSAATRDEIRRDLLPVLLGDEVPAAALRGVELDVAATLTCELAELTRGTEREALLAKAAAMGVPALLERRMQSRSAQRRLTAVETLSLFEDGGARTRAALDDRNPDVRLGAALALAQRDDSPTPVELVTKLRVGSEERSLLLVSLMTDLAEREPGAVAAILFDPRMPYEAKVAATDALAKCGGEYAPMLAQMAVQATGESDLQPRLYRALGQTGHPTGAQAIADGLASPEWPVRAAAAEAAGKAGMLQLASELGEMLADVNWWVRFRAGEALLRLGPGGLAVLRNVEAGEDETARGAARALLAERRAA